MRFYTEFVEVMLYKNYTFISKYVKYSYKFYNNSLVYFIVFYSTVYVMVICIVYLFHSYKYYNNV